MLYHPTIDKLAELRLAGMRTALMDQQNMSEIEALSFEERLGLLLDHEAAFRAERRLKWRLRNARLRYSAVVEDLDYRHPRGLDKALMTRLVTGQWIGKRLNLLITGPTGTGKSWIACALGNKACRDGFTVQYHRLSRLFDELGYAHGDGRYPKVMKKLARTDVIILDDWGLAKLTAPQRRELLEILEDRHERRSTLVTSQLPVEHWHKMIGEPTHADAILDRLVHNAYRIVLKGESMRKMKANGGGSLTA
ncbi:MAG: IS21-like element helper ATPase IstB [Rhodospirillaceae bacterium]|nr:IS21-like element helper ATPase IstB [Rhodospirillaceae bacterium]